jgi:acyl dehydratase
MNSKVFTQIDQDNFALLSGDYNPVHIDPIFARRTLFGSSILHGVHGLLYSINLWLLSHQSEVTITGIRSKFYKPIKLNKEVTFYQKSSNSNQVELTLSCDGTLMTRVQITYKEKRNSTDIFFDEILPPEADPLNPPKEEISSIESFLDLFLPKDNMNDSFPYLFHFLDLNQISEILATTRLVGMICPGLHSIYSELFLETNRANKSKNLKFKVSSFDRRFGMLEMKLAGPTLKGKIIAFSRPANKEQISMKEANKLKLSKEFTNQRAVIIGGSRGLGEVVAKIISAGGGSVRISFHQGMQDALNICNEIKRAGGDADCFQFNVLEKPNPEKDILGEFKPTHIYYFATPLIPQTQNQSFNQEIYEDLCNYYVEGFQNTFLQFQGLIRNFFYPSTSYIDENPKMFLEYVAAKKKAEEILGVIEKKNKIIIFKPRLPKMATDQTVSLTSSDSEDAAPIMLKQLKEFIEKIDTN